MESSCAKRIRRCWPCRAVSLGALLGVVSPFWLPMWQMCHMSRLLGPRLKLKLGLFDIILFVIQTMPDLAFFSIFCTDLATCHFHSRSDFSSSLLQNKSVCCMVVFVPARPTEPKTRHGHFLQSHEAGPNGFAMSAILTVVVELRVSRAAGAGCVTWGPREMCMLLTRRIRESPRNSAPARQKCRISLTPATRPRAVIERTYS